MEIAAKILDFTTLEIKHECILQEVLRSYAAFRGAATLENWYNIGGEQYLIWLTILKSENEFEQILCPKEQFFGHDNGQYYKYLLRGYLKNHDIKTVDIIHNFDNKYIAKDFKLYPLPISRWDYISVNGNVYEFQNLTQMDNGKIEIRVIENSAYTDF